MAFQHTSQTPEEFTELHLGKLIEHERLRESEARFRALADNIPQLAWMADPQGTVVWFNKRFFDFTGHTDDQAYGANAVSVIHPDHHDRVMKRYFEQIIAGEAWDDTFPMRDSAGAYHWFLSRAFPIFDEGSQISVWCGTNTDITDQREAEVKLQTAYCREMVLNRIGQAVRSTSDPEEIQSVAVRTLGEALKVDRAFFSMTDIQKDVSSIGQDYHREDLPTMEGHYKFSDHAVDPTAYHTDGKTIVLNDFFAFDWPEKFAATARAMRIRATIKVPIFTDGKLVARLVVAMADEPREWTADEIFLVETVAAQTRAAIDSARLREQEHRVAEQLQDALQPVLPESVAGLSIGAYTRPALDEAELGGDFYDVFHLNDSRYAMVIGDVSGKGLAAAQQLAMVRNSLRTLLYSFDSPAESAFRLNNIVTEHNLITGFVTTFISVFDIQTGALTYCSCGHEPGLVKRASGDVEKVESDGYPLGVFPGAGYENRCINLNPGDYLLLHTDGLTESGPNRRHMLGTDGLIELLREMPQDTPVQLAAESLVTKVKTLASGALHDDVAVLLIKRT